MDSVKSTVSVLEEGDFSEEGVVSRRRRRETKEGGGFNWRGSLVPGLGTRLLEGVLFCWRIPVFVEECVLISRRGSSASGVGGHTSLGRGAFDLEEGVYITWSGGGGGGGGVTHFCWRIKEGCILMSRRALGGDTLVGRGCEEPTTEQNIVGVAHFYACANLLTLF